MEINYETNSIFHVHNSHTGPLLGLFFCCLSCTFWGINSSNGQQLSDSWLHEFFMCCLSISTFHCACRRCVELFAGLVICDSWIRRKKKVIFIFLLFVLTLFCNSGKFSPLSTLQNNTFRLVNFPIYPHFSASNSTQLQMWLLSSKSFEGTVNSNSLTRQSQKQGLECRQIVLNFKLFVS